MSIPLFFAVRNFQKFQHYTDRRPPWIKLYRDLWDDPRFFSLSEAERYLLMGIFVLASQHENKVSSSQPWLKVKLLTSKAIPLQKLIDTEWLEWVEQDASKTLSCEHGASCMLADCYPSRARGETEVQRQILEEPASADLAFGEFQSVRLSQDEHGKLLAKLNGNLDGFIARLDRYSKSSPAKFKKYASHYAVILNWFDRDVAEGKIKPTVEAAKRSVHDYL